MKPSATSVLIVVDVQNGFRTGGNLPVPGGEQVVPLINRLADAFDNIVLRPCHRLLRAAHPLIRHSRLTRPAHTPPHPPEETTP